MSLVSGGAVVFWWASAGLNASAAEPPPGGIVASTADYGWTGGDFSVSDDGQARYDLPLWVPPGRGKVAPKLALSYSSDAGNGLLGVGWSLTGLSSIGRCAKTLGYDGASDGVHFTASDALCLGGIRLVPVSAAGQAERTYRTELESFAKIVAYGMADGVPDSFKMWAKDGTIVTFGATDDAKLQAFRLIAGSDPNTLVRESTTARVVVSWSVNKVEDRNGNAATVEYEEVEGAANQLWSVESRPKLIKYGPNREVRFGYATRSDPIESFGVGVHFREQKRLSSVSMWGGPQGGTIERLREYQLAYQNTSITKRSLLASVKECDHSLTCKVAQTFEWSQGGFDFDVIDTTVRDAGQPYALNRPNDEDFEVNNALIVGDFNGDERDDLVYPVTDTTLLRDEREDWRIRLATSTGFGPARDTGFQPPPNECVLGSDPDTCVSGRGRVRPIDVDLDGKLELMVWVPFGSGNRWRLYSYTDPGFSLMPDVAQTTDTDNDADPTYFADIDGNGLADYVTAPIDSRFDDHALDGTWSYRLNTGASGAGRFGARVDTNLREPRGFSPVDVDADGRVDMVSGDGTGWGLSATGQVQPRRFTSRSLSMSPADVNGDGLMDGVTALKQPLRSSYPMPAGELKAALNSGTGYGPFSQSPNNYKEPFVACPPELPPSGTEDPCHARGPGFNRGVRFVDFNGDGAQDVLVFRGGDPSTGVDIDVGTQLYIWRVGQFERMPLGTGGLDAGGRLGLYGFRGQHVLDFNGDGALDILHVEGDHLRVLKRRQGPPDRMTAVGDPDNRGRTEIDYTTLGDRTVYTPGTASYPLAPVNKERTVVSQHRMRMLVGENSAVGWDRHNHTYEAGRMDLRGRGWLGFAKHSVHRLSTNVRMVTEFDNSFYDAATKSYPYAFVPERITTTRTQPGLEANRTNERAVVNQTHVVRTPSGTRFLEVRKVIDTEREQPVNGTAWDVVRKVETDTTYDGFGNADLVVSTTTGGRKVTTDSTFRNDVANWLIGLPTRTLVTSCKTASDTGCPVRETTANYDTTTGNPTVSVVEPNRAALKVTTTTEYGPFGVVKSVERADNAGEKRKESFEYENEDKLAPTATVNAEGHRTTTVTHSGLGVPLKTTDPNGFVTTFRHDWFGRLRETNRSDRSFEKITHAVTPQWKWQMATTDVSGGGKTIVTVDTLGREREKEVKAFNGTMAVTYTSYDAGGRKNRVSRPVLEGQTQAATVTVYDAFDQPMWVTAPDGVVTRSWRKNREAHSVDGKGVESYTVATQDGDVASSYEDDPASDAEDVWLLTRFEYGPFGETTRMTAPDTTAQVMEYDLLGRRTKLTDPSSGVTTTTYNAFGEVLTETDAENRTTTYTYDKLGRVKTAVSPDGTLTNVWDTKPQGVGKLARATSPDGTVTDYTYTDVSQADTVKTTIDGTGYEIDYDYDNLGRPSQVKYPVIPGASTRLTVANTYNASGYLSQVRNAASGGTVYWTANTRALDGQLTRETYGNGVVTDRAYDPQTGLLGSVKATGPGTVGVLSNIVYSYDDNRNVDERRDGVHKRLEEFGYDSLNRLTDWGTMPAPGPGYAAFDANYSYDKMGNLTSESFQLRGQPAATTTYAYGQNGAPKHAVSGRNGAAFQYNDAGEQIGGGGRTITYTTAGLPKTLQWGQGQHTTYRYDASGARVRKQSTGNVNVITIGGLYERRDPAGTDSVDIHNLHNIVIEGRVVAQVNKVQATRTGPVQSPDPVAYLNTDQQGSTVLTTNVAGRETDEGWLRDLFYDPFGRRLGTDHQPLGNQRRGGPYQGYTGHAHDDEYGLINMKGRMYDPETRHFINPDTIIENRLTSQSHNRYAYVRNNPVTFTDPTGLWRSDSFYAPHPFEVQLNQSFTIDDVMGNPILQLGGGAAGQLNAPAAPETNDGSGNTRRDSTAKKAEAEERGEVGDEGSDDETESTTTPPTKTETKERGKVSVGAETSRGNSPGRSGRGKVGANIGVSHNVTFLPLETSTEIRNPYTGALIAMVEGYVYAGRVDVTLGCGDGKCGVSGAVWFGTQGGCVSVCDPIAQAICVRGCASVGPNLSVGATVGRDGAQVTFGPGVGEVKGGAFVHPQNGPAAGSFLNRVMRDPTGFFSRRFGL